MSRYGLWGRWDVEIRSQWKDVDGNVIGPIAGFADIRQTYSGLFLRVQTEASFGDLQACDLKVEPDGRFRIYGVYQNTPSLGERHASQIHRGAFVLEVEGDSGSPSMLRGEYWTDRATSGELLLTNRQPSPSTQ